jgi:hypothetical protein
VFYRAPNILERNSRIEKALDDLENENVAETVKA